MTALDYPVSIDYGSTELPYTNVHPHLGRDFKTPEGTDLVVAGQLIGKTGHTGSYQGYTYAPHLHCQEWFGDDTASTRPPKNIGKPGLILATGIASQWGKFITVKNPDGWKTTYCHLSAINVTAGQYIGDNSMTKQEAVAVLDSFWGTFFGRKIKDSELNEYVPFLLSGNPDGVFKKVCQFDELKNYTDRLNEGDLVNYFRSIYGKDPTAADQAAWHNKGQKEFAYGKFVVETAAIRAERDLLAQQVGEVFVPLGKEVYVKE